MMYYPQQNNVALIASLFPNPARRSDRVRVCIDNCNSNKLQSITLYDLEGRLVAEIEDIGPDGYLTFNRKLAKGHYIYRANMMDSDQYSVGRLQITD